MRECLSCAARPDEAQFPERSRVCVDCVMEAARAFGAMPAQTKARSRRSYRAALRHRQQSAQLDLVDMITPVPGGPL